MKKDKKKLVKIIVLIILIIILIVIGVIFIRGKILDNKSSNLLINASKEDLSSIQTNEVNNELSNEIENNNTEENNELSNEYGTAKIETPITMNDNKYDVEIDMSFVEWEYELEATFMQKIDVIVNGDTIDSFEVSTWTQSETLNYQQPEIRLLTDAFSGREYLMIVAYNYTPGEMTTYIKIYDENGNIIADLDDWGETRIGLKNTEYVLPSYRIYTDCIRMLEPLDDGGANLHEYTLQNGELQDEITETYTADEVEQVNNND